MNMAIGGKPKRIGMRSIALLICLTMLVQMFWSGDVALGASPYYFRGYDVENITSGTFNVTGATAAANRITMTDANMGEAIGFVALDETGHDISVPIDLGGLEIDFSTTTVVTEEGTGGASNDVPTVSIAFCKSNYSNVISKVDLAKPDNAVSGSVALTSHTPIPAGTRSIIVYLYGKNTSGSNTIVFENTSLIIRDASAPTCGVDYNHSWTKDPVTVTINAADGDSGLEGVYKNGVKMNPPYSFEVSANTGFTVYSKDYAGKTSDVQSVNITNIDTSVPATPSSLTLSHDTWTNNDVSVTVPALGTASGSPERYVYQLNGGAWANLPENFAVKDSGQFDINVAVVDEAGNRSSNCSDTIYIDKLAPKIDKVTTVVGSGSVDVSVQTSEAGLSGIGVLRYAEGSHDPAYFTSGGGTDIADNKFSVSAGGVFTIYVADNAGNYAIGEYTLNTAPTLSDIGDVSMKEDTPYNVVLDAHDGETALSGLTVTAEASDASLITDVKINKSDEGISLDLTPAENKSGGPVTVTVTITDTQGEKVTKTFSVTVEAVNDAPVAVDDKDIVTDEDTSVKIDVLANDSDTADGDTLTITDSGTPAHGTTSIVAGQIRYVPAVDYSGTDEFTYTISDGHGGTASATVYISAKAVNDAPVAMPDTAVADEDGSVLISVLDNDTDVDLGITPGEAISLYSVQNGEHGTAVIDGSAVRYTPNGNFFGKDTFTYVIHDAAGLESTGTVTVTITGEDDAPYFEGLNAEYTISEDSIGAEVTFLIKDVETIANSLMLQAVSSKDTLLENSGIVISGLGDSNPAVTLWLTPVADASGDVTVNLSLGDGFTTVNGSFLLHISNVNDAPTVKQDEVTYTEDSPSVTIKISDLLANDTDIEGDILSFGGIYAPTSVGKLTIVDADTLEYTPKANYEGTDSFQYLVSDGHGGSAISTCVLKATPVNDAPVVSIPTGPFSTKEDEDSAGITITVADQETAASDLLVSAVSDNADMIAADGITVVNNGDGTCTLTVHPIKDATGTATVTVTVSDGSLATSENFSITISPMPDAPIAVNDKIYVSISGRQTFAVLNNDRDVDGDAFHVVADSWVGHSLKGQLTFDEGTQKFTYRAANGEVGTGTFTYTITDGTYTSEPATVTLDIHSMTHAPVISQISNQYTSEDDAIIIPFTVTDVDLGDAATVSVTSSDKNLLPEDMEHNIVVTDNGGGSYKLTLKPAANLSGSTAVTVTVTDKTFKTDATSFILFVYADNDAPVAVNDAFTLDEDTTKTLTLLANDSDPENDTIWVNSISWPAHGWLTRSGSDFVYQPYGNWNGTETLTYSVTDGQANATATVTINVTPVNDAPVNYSNWVELPNEINQSATVNVLTSDYDPDEGDVVRLYQIVSGPSYGEAVMNTATGEITYKRTAVSPNANGADEIKYRIIDRETATGDYSYADAYLYIGIDFNSSLYAYDRYVYCYEDDAAFTFDLNISNPNSVTYNLTVNQTTALGTFEVVDADTVKFTPAANQNGYATIPFTVKQEGGIETDTQNIYLRVYPVNDAPVIDSAPVSASCAEDSAGTNITATFHDVDCADSDLYFYAYGQNADSKSPVALAVNLTIDRTTGTAQINAKPVADANGTIEIVLGVSDGIEKAQKVVLLTVVPIDDAPAPASVIESLYEDMDVTMNVLKPGTDVDGDKMIVTIGTGEDGPQHGSAKVNADGTITYTPNADYYGSDSLKFTVTDDTAGALSDTTKTANITVMPVNDQPVITDLSYYQTTKEDTPKDVTLTVTDVDNDLSKASSYTITSDNQSLIPNGNITISQVSGSDMSIHLVPAANASGSAIISIVASDGELSAESSFKLTVEPVNDQPVATDDTASADETVGTTPGTTDVTIDLLANDSDVEPGTLRVIAVSNISTGKVVNKGNGTVTYSAEGDYNGTATFDYTLMDAGGATTTAHVTVTVNAKNDPPRAENDARTITEDQSVTIPVLDNDSDIEGDTLSVTSAYGCAHGTATVEGTDVKYTPDEDYNGSDSFTYEISDGNGGTATAQVSIKITPVNDAPKIAKYAPTTGDWTLEEDTPGSFNFIVSDPETAVANLIITMDSKDKTIIKNPGIVLSTNAEGYKVITVTSLEDKYGVVPVDFNVTDGALSTKVTWNITIAAVNDAPEIDAPAIKTAEDKPVSGSVTAKDPENNPLKFYKETDPAHGSVTVNEDGTYTYTPTSNYSGPDSFKIYVDDGQTKNNTASGTVNVTVTPVNDGPEAVDDTASTSEDAAVTIPVLNNDTDPDTAAGDILTVVSAGTPTNGSAAIVEGGIEYTPKANWNGTDTFTYTVKDRDGEKDTATVTVTVSPANDAPSNGDITTETNEDTALTISLPSDIDIDEFTNPTLEDVVIIAVDDPAHGTASISSDKKSMVYTPDTNWFSTEGFPESFHYTVKDAGLTEREFTITVKVNPVNDDPYFDTKPANLMSLTEDLAEGSSGFVVDDIETAAAGLNVTFVSSTNTALVAESDVAITSTGTDGSRTVTVNPKDNKNGEADITLRVTDTDGGFADYTFTVDVTKVNDVPVAQNDSAETNENSAKTIDVLANDDVDLNNEGDTLTILSHSAATNGGTVDIVDNKIVYTPNPNRQDTISYTDTFTYTMQDVSLAQSSATVTMTITPVNDAPVILDPITNQAILEDQVGGTGVIAFTVSDEEDSDDTLNVSVACSNETLFPLANITVLNPEGGDGTERTVQAVPVKDGYGEANITLTVTDSGGKKDSVTFKVTVTPVDDPLGTDAKTYTVVEDVEKQIDVLADADADDPSKLTITAISDKADHGTVRIAADGKSLYYLTEQDGHENDTFVYLVHDAFGNQDYNITANIKVTPVNDAPVVTLTDKDSYTVSEGGAESNIPFSITDVDNNIDTEVTLAASSSNPVLVLGGLQIDAATGSDRTMDVQAYRKWNGTTTITITATDKDGEQGSTSFTFNVAPVNETPVAVNDTLSAPEDALTFLDVLDNDTDGDLETNPDTERILVKSVTASDPNATITRAEDGSGVNIQPRANWNGTVTFTYVAEDAQHAESNTATVTVTVAQVNDAPVADDETATTNEDTPITIDVLDGDTDIDQDADLNANPTAEVLSISLAGALDAPDHGSVAVVDGKVVYTPAANYNGPDSFEYFVTDGEAQDKGLVTVTVSQVNDRPVAVTDNVSTNEDTTGMFDVLANDTDVDTNASLNLGTLHARADFSISLESEAKPPLHGSISVVAGKIQYIPVANYNGPDTFKYIVLDGHGEIKEGTVNVTVNSVNDLPNFDTNPADISLTEDSDNGSSSFTVSDVETAGADLIVTLISSSNNTLVDSTCIAITKGTNGERTVTVDPKYNQNGTADVKLRVTDGDSGYAEYTFKVTVAAVNDAPVGLDKSGDAINEDTSYTLDWTKITGDDDIATNADTLSVSISTQGAHGNAVVSGNNIIYTPTADWNGVDSYVYTVTDSKGATDTGTVTVTVNQVNDAPKADADFATTNEEAAVTVDVLDGDKDVDQDAGLNAPPITETLNVSLEGELDAPEHGSVEVVDGKIVYTPAVNFNGQDSFEYFVTDEEAQDKGLVTVTVNQINDNPIAVDDTLETNEDSAKTIDVLDNDTDIDTDTGLNLGTPHYESEFSVSLTGVSVAPAHGSVQISGNQILYTPAANYYGPDSFTYKVMDGHGGWAEGTVDVTVNSENDLPVFVTTPADMEVAEDGTDGSSTFTVSDIETPAAGLSVNVISSSNTALVDTTDVAVATVADGVRTVTVNPKDNQNGTTDILLRVTDGDGGYNEYEFTVTVTAVNDAPIAQDNAGTINEDTSYTVNWTSLTSDVDIATNGDTIGVTVTTQGAHGNAVVSGNNIIYTPAANWNGVDSFVYTVKDSHDATDTGTITVTVNPLNDAPVAYDDTAETDEEAPVTVSVLAGDTDVDQAPSLNTAPEAEILSVLLTGALDAPDHGSVTTDGTTVTYTPNANYNGTDSFEYFVTDGEVQDKGMVTVTVNQVNDNPVAVNDSATTDEDVAKTIDVLANDTDVDTDEALNLGMLHYRSDWTISLSGATTKPAHGSVGVVDGKIVYTPDADYNGMDAFTYRIQDGHGASAEGTVTIDVGGENDPPVAADDTVSVDEDHTASFNVLINDFDEEGGVLSLVSFTDIAGIPGKLLSESDGDVTFTPDTDYNGSFTVHYQMSDGGLTDEAAVTITVKAVNDAPTADSFTDGTNEDTAKEIDVSGHIGDVDIATNGDSLTVSVETGNGPAHGSVSVTGTVITYTPNVDWNGTDSFTYTTTDSTDMAGTGVITVNVAAVNDAPKADDETATTNEGSAVTIDVLPGDTDVDMDPALNAVPQGALIVGSVGTPSHGSARIEDGKIVYTPNTNYSGTDSFTYAVSDNALTGTGKVTVTITQVNDAPEAADDTAATNDEEPVMIDVLVNDTDIDTDSARNQTPDSRNDFGVTTVSAPLNGTAVISGNKVKYTPVDTFAGEDHFTYTMSDGHGGTDTATVTVTVRSVNDPPETPVVHTPANGQRYGGESTVHVTWSGFDIDGDALTYALEYFDGSAWHGVQTGLTATEYDFVIPGTLTSILNLQFRVNASDAEFTSDYGYSGKVEVDKSIPANIVVTMKTADGKMYPAGMWTNQNVIVTAVSVEDASRVVFSYAMEDKAYEVAANRTVTSGVHTVYILATDEFGNASEFGGYLARIDKQPPAVPDVAMVAAGSGIQLNMTFKGDPGNSGNNYLIMPDGSRTAAKNGVVWTAKTNGDYAFKLYDIAGNVTNFTVTVTGIDQSAPVIACNSGNYQVGSKTEQAITAALSFTDSESEITTKGYALSSGSTYSGAYKTYTNAIEMKDPGTYYIHAYARNAFGLTTNQTFGPFIVAATAENPGTGETPGPGEKPVETGSVVVDVGAIAEISEGAVKVRMPGGEWTETLTLDDIAPGTYIIEVMDEEGNVTTVEITISDEEIAAGQWKPTDPHGTGWYVWVLAGIALLLILLLFFWRNVKVTMYDVEGEKVRSIHRLRRRKDEVLVTVPKHAVRGSAWGIVTLGRIFTRRMRGNMLVILQEDVEVLRVQVPKDAEGRFEEKIGGWIH